MEQRRELVKLAQQEGVGLAGAHWRFRW